jgi:hypothetical protein
MGRRDAVRLAVSLTLLLGAAGCASHHAAVDVRYPESGINRAMLATVAGRRVEVAPVADRRPDTTRIGTSPATGQQILTARPLTDVVREALTAELARNGHGVAGGRDAVLASSIDDFWLDAVAGYRTTQYVGKVALTVALLDGRTGQPLASRVYVGVKRREVEEPSESAEREVMDAALARAMHDLATDPELVQAFARVSPPR